MRSGQTGGGSRSRPGGFRGDSGSRTSRGGSARPGRPGGSERSRRPREAERAERVPDPPIDPDVEATDLDRAARARLRTLSKDNAEGVAKHLVMAGALLDTDPQQAYAHAQAALRRAGRVDVVREAVALTAYALGNYAEALRELRTVRRLSGVDAHRAIEADCERGLGRPERALTLAAEAPPGMSAVDRVELAIVASGARMDLGEPEAALLTLDSVAGVGGPGEQIRVSEQRINVLQALGREAEAAALQAELPEPEDDDVVFLELPGVEHRGQDHPR
ncbi:hypothetical protein ACO0LV_10630 [Pseudactinotalea sp. Z1739]|uniref:hypothetical protein n=1 Tax=Pseudactinotalea sp. Z1739 TaxID=3413028 RepID=UPI003C7E76A2